MKFNTKYKYVEAVSEDNDSATLRLDGTMGYEIDGAAVAAEINFLDKIIGVKNIHLRINTPGGSVFDSLSIAGAILSAKATTHGHNDGMCMSAGFHTFLACDILHAYDYSIFMYHNPRAKEGIEVDDEFLIAVKEGMSTLIAGRLNMTTEEVDKMLDNESFFSASKFNEIFGVQLNITSSERKPSITNSMTLEEVVAEFDNFNINLNKEEMSKENDYSNVLASLGVEATVENPLAKIETKVAEIVAENVTLTEAKSTLEGKVSELQGKLDKISGDEAVAYVNGLVEDKLLKEEAKDKVLAAYKTNPESVKAIYDSMPAPAASDTIESKVIERKETEGKNKFEIEMTKEGVAKDYQWYGENEPEVLAEMQTSDPEKFNFLLTEYTK